MKLFWTIISVILFSSQALVQKQLVGSNFVNKFDDDVLKAVDKYCLGKTTNFCSKANLFYVHQVENTRKMQQKKLVKNRILKTMYEIINKS